MLIESLHVLKMVRQNLLIIFNLQFLKIHNKHHYHNQSDGIRTSFVGGHLVMNIKTRHGNSTGLLDLVRFFSFFVFDLCFFVANLHATSLVRFNITGTFPKWIVEWEDGLIWAVNDKCN